MLLQTIKNDRMSSMKAKDTIRTKLLTTLLSDAQNVGLNDGKRESTDSEVINVVKKFIKNIDETLNVVKDAEQKEVLSTEKGILEGYLPTQLSEDEIQAMASLFLVTNENPNMGSFMKYMKTEYNGQYDGATASKIAKNTF